MKDFMFYCADCKDYVELDKHGRCERCHGEALRFEENAVGDSYIEIPAWKEAAMAEKPVIFFSRGMFMAMLVSAGIWFILVWVLLSAMGLW